MRKEKEGAIYPKKKKPSGEDFKKDNETHSEKLDHQNQIEEEYGIHEDGTIEANSVHIRHINRNEDKSRERTAVDNRRGSITRSQETSISNKPEHDNHVRKSGNTQAEFFVLILSKKQAKFFHGDLSGLKHIEISELPNGINDVVHLEEKDDQILPGSTPSDKENISMYLKEVDRTLWTSGLNQSTAPLVIAGVEYICATFKHISQYKHIANGCLIGSFENADPKVIYKKAQEIINPASAD